MKTQFETLFVNLEKSLDSLDQNLAGLDRYARGIELIKEKVLEIRALGTRFIKGRDTEVEFFRTVWPAFWGKLLLYWQLYQFEKQRWTTPPEGMEEFISLELRQVAAFFQSNQEFWMRYRRRLPALDEEFTRASSQSLTLDPVSLLMDGKAATMGSYMAAQCEAMESYKVFLYRERERLLQPDAPEDAGDYTWGGSDTDFVECLNLLQAVGAIFYKGKRADLGHLQKWARWAINKYVANIYDRFNILRNRKRERMAFTKRATVALEKKMDGGGRK